MMSPVTEHQPDDLKKPWQCSMVKKVQMKNKRSYLVKNP